MLNFFKKNKYKIETVKIGIKEIYKFLNNISEINLIVVSDNIMQNNPIKNVESFNLL